MALLLMSGCDYQPRVIFPTTAVIVEIADSPAERELGLMGRDALPEGRGMLFIFDKPDEYGFWMKNTKISLDIIFLDAQKNIVDILSADPCIKDPCETYMPKAAALYAVEVPGGFANNNGIMMGDTARFQGIRAQPR